MSNIFLVPESEYDYDSHHHRNVKAFVNYIDAETVRFKLETAQKRKNGVCMDVRHTFIAWETANPRPQPPLLGMSMPGWNQKNGKKKDADPVILAAFKAEEERVRTAAREHSLKNAELYNAWEARAIVATREMLVEAGMTKEEADTIDNIGAYLDATYYDYNVEEVEFG